ncbi:extracellular solute-binding protein [Paenibacillus sp. TAB 01]|uniref:extracellular solute-binding protein n=1 Tax=Paenibacillus sp. TAB 01 TaxID=3368988 RepID=UPI003753ABC5
MKTTTFAKLLPVLLTAGAIAGCAQPGKEEAAAKDTGPTPINIMMELTLTEPPADDNPVKQEIEKRTNTKLNISWVSSNNFVEKQNVTLASGDIPELMMVNDAYDPQVMMLARQGAFWDITPFVKDYPNLQALQADSWKNTSIDGKSYGVPRLRALIGGGNFPLIRKDWLDQLGLKQPETMDDIYQVFKAFTEQ